jgi:hypothetical protein
VKNWCFKPLLFSKFQLVPLQLVSIRRLVVHHGATLLPQLHTTVLAMIPAVDSLRSSIAKLAMALVKAGLCAS